MTDSDEEWNDFNNLGKKKTPIANPTPNPTPKTTAVAASYSVSNLKPQTYPSSTALKKKPKAASGEEDSWDMEEEVRPDAAKVSSLDYDAVISGSSLKDKKM